MCSLDEYEVYQDDGSDPTLNVAAAAGHMRPAAQLAAQLGEQLSEAQNAIAGQCYRDWTPVHADGGGLVALGPFQTPD